jgi:hypothetical protein
MIHDAPLRGQEKWFVQVEHGHAGLPSYRRRGQPCYMRSAAFNSIEQFSACTFDGRRTACLGALSLDMHFLLEETYGY